MDGRYSVPTHKTTDTLVMRRKRRKRTGISVTTPTEVQKYNINKNLQVCFDEYEFKCIYEEDYSEINSLFAHGASHVIEDVDFLNDNEEEESEEDYEVSSDEDDDISTDSSHFTYTLSLPK